MQIIQMSESCFPFQEESAAEFGSYYVRVIIKRTPFASLDQLSLLKFTLRFLLMRRVARRAGFTFDIFILRAFASDFLCCADGAVLNVVQYLSLSVSELPALTPA